MNVLVTGGAGYIGSVLVRQLLARGHSVLVVDSFRFGGESLRGILDAASPEMQHGQMLRTMQGDIREPQPEWFAGIDAVVHLAGFSNDPTADADPVLNHEVNVTGTRRIAEAAIAAGIATFTFGSSASVYDQGKLDFGKSADEHDDVQPIGAYSISKYRAELILLNLAEKNHAFRPVIFRQATVFGQSPRMRYDLVVNAMVRDAVRKGTIQVHGEQMLWRPLIEVEALARLHVIAVEAGTFGPCTVNAVGGNYTVSDLAMIVAGVTGAIAHVVPMPEGRRVRNYRCSTDRLLVLFGPGAGFASVKSSAAHMAGLVPEDAYDARFENIAAMRKAGALA